MARISLDQLRKAASSGRRSTLYYWMREHHARISEALADAGRPNWEALAETFAKAGLTDRRNEPPTAAIARQTWHKVCAVLAKQQPAAATNRPPAASTTVTLPAQQPSPARRPPASMGGATPSLRPPSGKRPPRRPAAAAVSVTRPDAIDLTARDRGDPWQDLDLPGGRSLPCAIGATATDAEAEALRRQLLERARMREAAVWLERRPQLGHAVFARGMSEATQSGRAGYFAELLRASLTAVRGPVARADEVRRGTPRLWQVTDAIARMRRLLDLQPKAVSWGACQS